MELVFGRHEHHEPANKTCLTSGVDIGRLDMQLTWDVVASIVGKDAPVDRAILLEANYRWDDDHLDRLIFCGEREREDIQPILVKGRKEKIDPKPDNLDELDWGDVLGASAKPSRDKRPAPPPHCGDPPPVEHVVVEVDDDAVSVGVPPEPTDHSEISSSDKGTGSAEDSDETSDKDETDAEEE